MNCLITGGAGFIGSHLAQRMFALNLGEVRILDNFTRARFSPADLRDDGLDALVGDIRDRSALRSAMTGCETVFHLAAKATVMDCEEDPSDALSANTGGTFEVLRMAHELGVGRVIVASSREVYGEPTELPVNENCALLPKNAYGASKAAAEMYCSSFAAAGLEVTALRLSNVFGPGDHNRVIPRFLVSARAGNALTIYGGAQIVDFIWVDRVVDAFVSATTGSHVRGSVNVASGIGVTILEAARRVLASCGSDSPLTLLPSRDAEVSRFVADVSRAARELGLVRPDDPLAELAQMGHC
jgi:UDP-N-acetylglucosamine/UDP-N-acetyl-alpha-D-glucosaminouronate 4-epimerase